MNIVKIKKDLFDSLKECKIPFIIMFFVSLIMLGLVLVAYSINSL